MRDLISRSDDGRGERNECDGWVFERYRLTLTHDMVSAKGGACRIDDPIVTEYVVDRRTMSYGEGIVVNEMLNRLRAVMLRELERK